MISLHQNPSANVYPAPILAPGFIQALTILQMPILELSVWIQKQLEENPLVELIYENSPLTSSRVIETKRVVEQRDCYKEKSLHEHLESQARLFFNDSSDLQKALKLIANLDEKGYLPKETPDCPILKALQNFDPPGVFARSLQESLLLQLLAKGEIPYLAYEILDKYFDDLLHRRIAKIRKCLRCTSEQVYEAIHADIASLSLNPAGRFSSGETLLAIPDLFLREEEGIWQVEINKAHLPKVRLHARYLSEEISSEEAKDYLRSCFKEANRLILSVRRRSSTLVRLGQLLLRTQRSFLEGQSTHPCFLTIRDVAQELKLHAATIARAIANKNVSCGHYGILPLSFFFRRPEADISQAIIAVIAKENEPLSDEQIAAKLRASGVPCARRTVSKYRARGKIPPSSLRK